MTGSHGFIGSAAVAELERRGHEVWRLTRGTPHEREVAWNPSRGAVDAARLEGFDAVVHLAGEPLTGVRWTAAKKRRILESRVNGTLLLVDTLATLKQRPQAFVAASAIGIYGERHAELLSESAATGEEFLAETVQAWEAETARAATLGTREVRLRFGVVLGANGGALRVFARTARLGLGTVFGSGKQIVSWVALSDAARAIAHAVETSSVEGPVNVASPNTVTHEQLVATLANVLHRPHFLRMPAIGVRALFGEMGVETLLYSQRVDPAKLLKAGFAFEHASLDEALRHELGRR